MDLYKSTRGGRIMSYQGYEYLLHRTINDIDSWRCREYFSIRCHATMKIQGLEIVSQPTRHSHESSPQDVKANPVLDKMKDKMQELCANPRKVIGAVLLHEKVSLEVKERMPKRATIQRNLRKHRAKINKSFANPTTAQFAIPQQYRKMILHDSGEEDPDRILAIGDRELLPELQKDTIFGDGTFDKAPSIFYQLYTWHAKIGNTYPPCIYFLLQKKNQDTYNRMFEILKQLLPNLAPETILLDFEKACMSAAQLKFPESQIKGCYFHLTQSLIRKIGSVGLKTEYDGNIDVKLKLKSLAALAYVPINDVENLYLQLAIEFPDEQPYNDLLTYFESTYITGPAGREPMFPMAVWNHFDAAAEQSPKTTNCCEGFHNSLNSLFNCSHPGIWKLLDGLKEDIQVHLLVLGNENGFGGREAKRAKYERLNRLVATAVEKYDEEVDKLKYLRHLANLQ